MGGAAQGDLVGALVALPVLLGQVHALQTLLLLRLLLPLLLVITLIASNDLGWCAPAAVLRGRLRLGAGAARQVVDNLLLEGEAHVHVSHPRALSRGVRLL